jgi:hypothetical protein
VKIKLEKRQRNSAAVQNVVDFFAAIFKLVLSVIGTVWSRDVMKKVLERGKVVRRVRAGGAAHYLIFFWGNSKSSLYVHNIFNFIFVAQLSQTFEMSRTSQQSQRKKE